MAEFQFSSLVFFFLLYINYSTNPGSLADAAFSVSRRSPELRGVHTARQQRCSVGIEILTRPTPETCFTGLSGVPQPSY